MKIKIILSLVLLLGFNSFVMAAPDFDKLADAIGKAENSKTHPYGIMVKYKKTTPRQACINTCKHAWRDFKGEEKDFIDFLGSRYCPTDKKTLQDPKNACNRYWTKNVKYLYEKMSSNKLQQ